MTFVKRYDGRVDNIREINSVWRNYPSLNSHPFLRNNSTKFNEIVNLDELKTSSDTFWFFLITMYYDIFESGLGFFERILVLKTEKTAERTNNICSQECIISKSNISIKI